MTGWQQVQVTNLAGRLDALPKEYVQKERYLTDKVGIGSQLTRLDNVTTRIEGKLDQLILSLGQIGR